MAESRNPLKAVLDIRRDELPMALLMFGQFFLVITSFWILKPIKKSLFIQFYDQTGFLFLGWQMNAAQAEQLAKVLNMFVAFVAAAVFAALATRLRRQRLVYVFAVFFMGCYALYVPLLDSPDGPTVWTFYLFGDLFSTLMVATFFAFLNDSVTAERSKRIYGLVGLGGVTGGVVGSSFVAAWIAQLETSDWLWVCTALAVTISVLAWGAGREVEKDPPPDVDEPAGEEAPAGNPAIEGARLVFRSPYLLSVVGIVGLYEIASTIIDFQFTSTIQHYLEGPAIGQQFARVFALTNTVSMLVQLLLTSFVMTRFGVGVALLVLPVAALSGSAAFMIFPGLWFGSLLNTADNGFSYSINQSAKEALYVPTTREEKYKAKAFIDMFVQRFAKAIAVGLSLGITAWFGDFSSVRWLSIVTVAVIAVWLVAVRYAGRRYAEKEAEVEARAGA